MADVAASAREIADSALEIPAREAAAYRAGHDRPLGGYAVLLAIYGTLTTTLGWLVRRRGSLPERVDARDLAGLAVATHKLSRLVTKDSVTAVVRAPFTTYVGPAGPGEVHEEVRGTGLRHAVGELVGCPFCVAMWIATLLAFGLLLAPRATRVAAAVLTAVTASDTLQLAYAVLQQAAEK